MAFIFILLFSEKNHWAEEAGPFSLSGLNRDFLPFVHASTEAAVDDGWERDVAFVSNGFANWKDATISFRKRDSSKHHKEAFERMVTLPATTRDIGETLSSLITLNTLWNPVHESQAGNHSLGKWLPQSWPDHPKLPSGAPARAEMPEVSSYL